VLRAGTGEAGRQMLEQGHRLEIGDTSMIGWCIANKQARVALDMGEEAIRFENPWLPETRSELTLPLISRGQAIGALTIQSSEESAFRQEDVAVLQTMADQLANAIQNARLFEESHIRAEELAALNELAHALTARLNVEEVLDEAYQGVSRLVDTRNFFVALHDLSKGRAGFDLVVEEGEPRKVRRAQVEGLAEYVIRSRQPLLIQHNMEGWLKEKGVEMLGQPALSWLGVPLLVGNRALGVMAVQSYAAAGAFSEHDRDLLAAAASQVAIAVQNAYLFEEARVRADELTVLNELGQALTARLNVDQVLEEAYRGVSRLLDTTNFFIGLYDQEKDEIRFVVDTSGGEDRNFPVVSADQGLAGYIVRNRTSVLVQEDIPERVQEMGVELVGEVALSWLGVPLLVGDRVLGVMAVQSYTTPYAYDEHDQSLLTAIASSTAIAIQNAYLFEETRSRAERLALLNRIARAVGAPLDLDDLLETVYQEASIAFRSDAFFIALCDEEVDEMDVRIHQDLDLREPRHRRSLGRGLTSYVVREKRPLLVRSEAEYEHLPVSPVLAGTGKLAASWLGVPMLIGDRVIGVLCVQAYHEQAYGEEDQQLLSTIADQVSVAVESARLFEQAQQEILERKRAEEGQHRALADALQATQALQESEERYRALVAQAPIGVITCDRRGVITHVNPAILQILGFSDEKGYRQLNLLTMPSFVKSGMAAAVRRCMEFAAQVASDYQYRSDAEEDKIVRLRLTPLFDEEGEVSGALGTIEDVTEQRRLQEQLIHSAKLASIGELAAGVAHEINNPINGIINYAQLLLNKAEPDGQQVHFLEGILREGDRVASIVRDLLAFARVEREPTSLAHLPDVLRTTLTLSGQQLKRDGIILEIQEQPDLPPIRCRSQRIQQVFLNLVSNARDALNARYPNGDPNKRLIVRIEQVEKEDLGYIRIVFHDCGEGISPDNLSNVFTPFFTTKRPGDGTGLGLSVSYGIVQDHGGDIHVESTEGEYTSFWVDLPLEPKWEI
jgi:PAS domain S-box-containing protein